MEKTAVRFVAALAAALSAAPAVAAPAACHAATGRETVALVELYTSEGCDSCPPADRWLSTTFGPGAKPGAVAVAFHVDYWDRLGWRDRFATAAWTKRQYDSARAARSDLVYTPQVLVQGRDFGDWRNGSRSSAAIAALARLPARADIALDAAPEPGRIAVKASAHVPASADRKGTRVFVALTEDGLVSEVKAGENAGKRLVHDHVVRALREVAVDDAGNATGTVALPLATEAGTGATVVAFVQNVDTGVVLQALSLPLESGCAPPR
jgi:hypothetical protein